MPFLFFSLILANGTNQVTWSAVFVLCYFVGIFDTRTKFSSSRHACFKFPQPVFFIFLCRVACSCARLWYCGEEALFWGAISVCIFWLFLDVWALLRCTGRPFTTLLRLRTTSRTYFSPAVASVVAHRRRRVHLRRTHTHTHTHTHLHAHTQAQQCW